MDFNFVVYNALTDTHMAKIKTNITAWKKMGNPDNISRTNDSILCDTFWTKYTYYKLCIY